MSHVVYDSSFLIKSQDLENKNLWGQIENYDLCMV